MQGLDATLEYDTAHKYFREISVWGESALKELGLRKIRMQTSVPLPGNSQSIESLGVMTHEAWKDYKDSFDKRFRENPLKFIKELKNFLSEYKGNISLSEYSDISRLLFAEKLKFESDDEKEVIRNLFRKVPELVKGSLDYSLNWPSDSLLNNISLVVDSLSYILLKDALSQEKYLEIRSDISQPIADFLNTQDFRNISGLGFSDSKSMLETAVKIVYLAGESAKTHDDGGEIDHLKMRMIQGVPSLFKNISINEIDSLDYPRITLIKEFWDEGCELLSNDEPYIWKQMQSKITPINESIISL